MTSSPSRIPRDQPRHFNPPPMFGLRLQWNLRGAWTIAWGCERMSAYAKRVLALSACSDSLPREPK